MSGDDRLDSVVGLTSAAIGLVGSPDGASWRFARCWLLAVRYEHHGGAERDIDLAFEDLLALPDDVPGRAKLASVLITATLRRKGLADGSRVDTAARIRAIADTDPNPLSPWPATSAALRSQELLRAAMHGKAGFDLDEAFAEVQGMAEVVQGEAAQTAMVEAARIGLRQKLDERDGSISAFDRPVASPTGDPRLVPFVEVLETARAFQSALLRQDLTAMRALWKDLCQAAEHFPPESPVHQVVATLRPVMAKVGDPNWPGFTDDPEVLRQMLGPQGFEEKPGMATSERVLRMHTSALATMGACTPAAIDEAITRLAEVARLTDPHDPRRPLYLTTFGSALIDRYGRTRRRPDLVRGTEVLEEAKAAMGSHTSPWWVMVCTPLAHAYRMGGRRDLAHEVMLSGLHGNVWSALLQTETDHAHAAARSAASDALDAARMCLADNAPERAVAALDSGRGLILYSAMEKRGLDHRLADAGQPDLAARWRRVDQSDQPEDLRREVLTALATDPTTRLLDPPAVHEIRAALGALGMDALVYLMPGDEHTGAAVVVPAEDEVNWLALPELKNAVLGEFQRRPSPTARGTARREAEIAGPTETTLDDLCEWGWRVAMGPLLAHLAPSGDRPVRLVLVPMGALVRIPWHATHTEVAGRRVHAVERAVLSYTPSARLLCETAWRRRVPITGTGLVVGDPDTAGTARALPAARQEAEAVRAAFYPRARHVGRVANGASAPDGRGDKADLVSWLEDRDGGGVGHLACHGVVDAATGPGATSYLLLAGGERFAAEDLVRTLASTPGRDIALVVLAACSTAKSGRGDDEAFTLGSAFLAANVRSAVTAQWGVPDSPAAALMFMFHHYLRAEGRPPVDALRAAQLWALADRTPPPSMPEAIRDHLYGLDEVTTWAAFIHSGQ